MHLRHVSQLTAWVFVFHALLGCCVHHAHLAQPVDLLRACTSETLPDDTAGPCSCAPESGHGDGRCEGSLCVYLRGKSPNGFELAGVRGVMVGLALPTDRPRPISSHRGEPALKAGSGRPIRLHLLLQVLLV